MHAISRLAGSYKLPDKTRCSGDVPRPATTWQLRLARAVLCLNLVTFAAPSQAVEINVVGGLGGVSQYRKLEEPFWREEITRISEGKIKATIRPFDSIGLPSADMLRLIQNSVVPFGTSLLSLVADDDPVLSVADLPALNPDFATLRRSVEAFRPHLKARLKARYDIELLAVYTYPAQVLFCKDAFSSLADLRGRRVRVASVDQSVVMTALGAIPVKTSFAEIITTINRGTVDCAITGTLSGNEIGLSDATRHIHGMALNWGLSIFSANGAVWRGLEPDVQEAMRTGLAHLESRVWEAANSETANGLACNTGLPTCSGGKPGKMALVPVASSDIEARYRLLAEVSLPRWIERCGDECAAIWNEAFGPQLRLFIDKNRQITTSKVEVN